MHYFIFVMLVFRLPGLLWGGYSGVFGSFLGNILLFLNFKLLCLVSWVLVIFI